MLYVDTSINAATAELGMTLRWEGEGLDERGIIESAPEYCVARPGTPVVGVDPRYFRPAEVETLLGDATKARERLGWVPAITFTELVTKMMREDLNLARRDHLVQSKGFKAHRYFE